MIQEHFYLRLMLIVLIGILYVGVMVVMSKSNPRDELKKTPISLKILGGFLFLIGLYVGFIGIYALHLVEYPSGMMVSYPADLQIVRSPEERIIWGYATAPQNMIISYITMAMVMFGLGAYFFLLKKSFSKWWKKILKVLLGIILYIFYAGSTDFHYFDTYEWIPKISVLAVAIVLFYFLYIRNKLQIVSEPNIIHEQIVEQPHELSSPQITVDEDKEDPTRFMPKSTSAEEEKANPQEQMYEDSLSPKYCRHCGKEIENHKYCKYCGTQI